MVIVGDESFICEDVLIGSEKAGGKVIVVALNAGQFHFRQRVLSKVAVNFPLFFPNYGVNGLMSEGDVKSHLYFASPICPIDLYCFFAHSDSL